MAQKVLLPQLGISEESAVIGEFYVKAGDAVSVGQPLFSLETGKSVFDVESEHAGTVLALLCQAGDELLIKAPVMVIGQLGELVEAAPQAKATPTAAPVETAHTSKQAVSVEPASGTEAAKKGETAFLASPRARALADAGLRASLTPRGASTGANLAAQWPSPVSTPADERPARVLFTRGDLAASTVADGLRERGWQVDEVVAYRTVTAPAPPADVRDAWRTGQIRAALLTSASTVRALVEHLGPPPAGTLLVAIGPTTADEARRLGLTLAATADEQTMSALVVALARAAERADDRTSSRPAPEPTPPIGEDGPSGHQEVL